MSSTHTHSGPGGYFQYILYDITSLGYVRENFDVMVTGIVQVCLTVVASGWFNQFEKSTECTHGLGKSYRRQNIYRQRDFDWCQYQSQSGIVRDESSRGTGQVRENLQLCISFLDRFSSPSTFLNKSKKIISIQFLKPAEILGMVNCLLSVFHLEVVASAYLWLYLKLGANDAASEGYS